MFCVEPIRARFLNLGKFTPGINSLVLGGKLSLFQDM